MKYRYTYYLSAAQITCVTFSMDTFNDFIENQLINGLINELIQPDQLIDCRSIGCNVLKIQRQTVLNIE